MTDLNSHSRSRMAVGAQTYGKSSSEALPDQRLRTAPPLIRAFPVPVVRESTPPTSGRSDSSRTLSARGRPMVAILSWNRWLDMVAKIIGGLLVGVAAILVFGSLLLSAVQALSH